MARRLPNLFKKYSSSGCIYPLSFETKNSWSSKVKLDSTVPVRGEVGAEPPMYIKTDEEYKITKKLALKTLESLLKVKKFAALEILSNNKELMNTTTAAMKSNYSYYLEHSLNSDVLLKYPALLAVENIETKLPVIEKLHYNINTVAILLLLPINILKKLVQSELEVTKEKGRIATIAKLLQVKEDMACEFIAKKPFLCSLPIDRIEDNVKMLTNFGIRVEDIQHDLWVLRYCAKTIESRLADAEKFKVDSVKTWMVRVQPEIFRNYLKRRSDNKSILGDSSLTEYLSERLECSGDVANYLILKQPALKNKNLKKLKELIDFLYAAGFKSHHICRVPKILVHSVETTRKRLKQLEEKNIQIDSLHMLTKSQKQFMQYYEALLKSKNKQKRIS